MITELDKGRQRKFLDFFQNTRFRYIHEYNRHKGVHQGSNVLEPEWNERDFGVFFNINGFPAEGSTTEDRLVSLNCNYVDMDVDGDLSHERKDELIQEAIMLGVEAGAPPPTIVVRTKNGAHLYWLYPEPIKPTPYNLEVWREVEKGLVHVFMGDKAAVDPSRVLRVPYTMHLKEPNDPFLVRVTSYKPEAKITLTQIQAMLPPQIAGEVRDEKIPAIDRLINGVPVGEGQRHAALAQVAGVFLKGADTPEKVAVARKNFYDWDQKVVGSPERFAERKKELDNTFDGILKREMAGKEAVVARETKAPPRFWSIGEIMKHDYGEQKWVVQYIIPVDGIAVISGNPGDYKTWIAMHTALCVARGTPVFKQFQSQRGAVLIVDEESHPRMVKDRMTYLGAKIDDDVHFLSQSGFKVDAGGKRNMVIEYIKEKNIKLVIIDSLVRIHGGEENTAGEMAVVFENLRAIVAAGASILLIHHNRKQSGYGPSNPGQSMRGSSDILASVDCHLSVQKKQDEDRIIVKQPKLRHDEAMKTFEISILKENKNLSGFEYAGEFDEKKQKTEEAMESVVTILTDGHRSRAELMEVLMEEFGKTTAENAIKGAFEKGLIEKIPKEELPKEERKKDYYRLPGAGAAGAGTEDRPMVSLFAVNKVVAGAVEEPVGHETYPEDWGTEDAAADAMTPDEWFESLP